MLRQGLDSDRGSSPGLSFSESNSPESYFQDTIGRRTRMRRMSIGSSYDRVEVGLQVPDSSELREQSESLGNMAIESVSVDSSTIKGSQQSNLTQSLRDTDRRSARRTASASPLRKVTRKRSSQSFTGSSEQTPLVGPKQSIPDITVGDDDGDEYSTDAEADTASSSSSVSDGYDTFNASGDVEAQVRDGRSRSRSRTRYRLRPRWWPKAYLSQDQLFASLVKQPIAYLPSVMVGTLLNILDGLSYGMILFPVADPLFADMGMAGLSMFYISCIVAQLVYSCGGSMFKGAAGGQMIEVVPFFYSMASTIAREVGRESPDRVLSSTIVAYSLSSIVTGLVFFLLGYLRLGSLIGFFPRHILVGCVGGVGWFLFMTGLEVTSGLGSVVYSLDYFKRLFEADVLMHWLTPLIVGSTLIVIQRFNRHPLVLPVYFIGVFAIFHLIVWVVPSLSLDQLRSSHWVFQPPELSEPWYSFYSFYDFKKVDFAAIARTIPAMLALTFFGILHVPINVPALAASTGEDDVNVDGELIGHGISNALSGIIGSVQNYLVYTNSLLFIKSGAESRFAGFMLATATAIVLVSGPSLIGIIPVMVVGALIFLLGFELLEEALVDTWGRLNKFEYATIVAIVVTMGMWDFVYGILVGIMLACVTFVYQASQTDIVTATYTGQVARSTVRRHPVQRKFLQKVGDQIYVLKLTGALFFGTIFKVEVRVRSLLSELEFTRSPIRYLIIDISGVSDIDFSAADTFARLSRLLQQKNVYMLLCGAHEDVRVMRGLKAIRLWHETERVRVFPLLNQALEWCENEFLSQYYQLRKSRYNVSEGLSHAIPVNRASKPMPEQDILDLSKSPRAVTVQQAVETTVQDDIVVANRWNNYSQPLSLFMQVFQDVSDRGEDFWHAAGQFFRKEEVKAGTVLYHSESEATGFYVVQSGILRADYDMEQGKLYETILAGTTCGELPFFSETSRTATVTAEVDSVVWVMDRQGWEKAHNHDKELAEELLRIALRLTVERLTSITACILISN
uniref:ARAD1B20284p n=1 Tax=Blastobotrys adeninivorans TaxID=409370 RepID=A0A060T743_BLAAD